MEEIEMGASRRKKLSEMNENVGGGEKIDAAEESEAASIGGGASRHIAAASSASSRRRAASPQYEGIGGISRRGMALGSALMARSRCITSATIARHCPSTSNAAAGVETKAGIKAKINVGTKRRGRA